MLACHPLHQWTPSLESHIKYYSWLFLLTYIHHTTGPHACIHFYLHFPNFTSFSFYLQPHFHPVFVLFSFTWLLSLSWIFTIFPTPKARLGPCIFLHLQSGYRPFQFGLETSLRKTTSYNSHFDVIFILLPTPYLPHFACFPTPFWRPSYMGSPIGFLQTSPPQTTFLYIWC